MDLSLERFRRRMLLHRHRRDNEGSCAGSGRIRDHFTVPVEFTTRMGPARRRV